MEEHKIYIEIDNGSITVKSSGPNDCVVIVDKDNKINYPDYSEGTKQFMADHQYDLDTMTDLY